MPLVRNLLLVTGFTALGIAPAAAQNETIPPPSAPEQQPMADPCPSPCGEPTATPAPPPETKPVAEAPAHKKTAWHVFAWRQTAITTGAGVTNYFGKGQQADLSPGAGWDARVTVGTRSILGFEMAYVGSVNEVKVPGTNGQLTGNGFDADVRVNVLPYRISPYVFGGVGYNHMGVFTNGNPEVSNLMKTSDNQFVVPAGAGVSAYFLKHATVDLRGTYRFIDSDSMFPMNATNADNKGEKLHQWTAAAHIGYQF
jgi:hypothetical protein